MKKYTVKDFQREYPNDDVCLDYIFQKRIGEGFACPSCKKVDSFYRIKKRKSYACSWCGYQIAPTAGTIFHKSSTPLTLWFHAVFLFGQSKNGVSAKELERHLGVTYKCAYRIGKQVRSIMEQQPSLLGGTVEADETYIGGKGGHNKRGRGAENKTPVFGMVERKGNVKAKTVANAKAATVMPLIRKNVAIGTNLMTDEFQSYNKAESAGYKHERVKHSAKEYARGNVHTNTIEGFWSQLKRSIDGTYHFVSPKYLQTYVDECAFHYNARTSALHPFELLIGRI